ncbi:MAG: hypothetical protein WD766_15190 [Gemmatimonadota bacterium]
MKSFRALIGLPLVLALVACAGDADDDIAVIDETEEVMPQMTEPATPMPEPAAAQTASFEPVGDSGISGEATVTDRGQQTEIMVRLTGAEAGEHPGHIHSGTCASIGGVVQPLESITADATGTGTMTTTVELPAMTVMNGEHVIAYHPVGGGPPATCAQIPTHAM